MSTTACTQPGCTGSDPRRLLRRLRVARTRLGRLGRTAAVRRPASATSVRRPGRCTQPGCSGTVVDGYCDVCGSPAPQAARRRPAAGAAARMSVATMPAGVGPVALDRVARLRTGSPRRRSAPRAPAPAAARSPGGSARRRPGCAALGSVPGLTSIPPVPAVDAAEGGPEEPDGAGGPAHLPVVRVAGRALPRRPARAHRGLLPELPQPVLLHAQAEGGRRGRRPVRGRRRHRPRRPRLDLRRPRPQRLRPLGGAQGPAELRRPRRPRRGHRRAAVPRPGRAPAHRRDLQLRDARGRRLHRHGVRRRHLAQAAAQGADAGRGRRLRPAAGRPGDRLHHRGPARLPVPARPQPGVLRLQAGQPHPGGRRRQADRPRRGAPPRRPRLRDLRHDGLPGAGGAARRPVGGLRHLHDRAHADRARDGVPRLPEHLRRLAPAGRRDAAVPEARLALPAAAQGVRPRPGRPLRLRGRAAGAAPRGAARGAWPLGREGAAEHSTSSLLFDVPTVSDDSLDWQDLPAPAHRRQRPADAVAADRQHRRPGAAAGRPRGCAREQPRGAARPGPSRARGRAARAGRRRGAGRCSPTTRGSGAPCGCRAWSPSPGGRRPRRRARSTRSTGRCPASWRPSWHSAFACETGGDTDVAESLYVVCARTDANYIAPAAFGLARIRSGRGDVDGRGPRPGPGARRPAGRSPRRGVAGPACSPSRAAACRRWRPPWTASRASPSTPSTGPASASRCSPRRWASSSRTVPTPRSSIAGRPAAEPALRDGLEAAYRDLAGYASSREERVHLVDRANAVRRWTLR